MKIITTGFFLVFCITLKAQPQYPIELPVYNIGLLSQYTIQAKVLSSNVYQYTLRKEGDPTKVTTFTLRPNNLESFQANIDANLTTLLNQESNNVALNAVFTKDKDKTLNLLFYQFVASEIAIDSHDTRPVAGKIFFGKSAGPPLPRDEQKKITEWIENKLDSAEESVKALISLPYMEHKLQKLRNWLPERDKDSKVKILLGRIENLESQRKNLSPESPIPLNQAAIAKFRKDLDDLEKEMFKDRLGEVKVIALNKIKISYSPLLKFTIAQNAIRRSNLTRQEIEVEANKAIRHLLLGEYKIQEVEIEFNEGFIENIKVIGDQNGRIIKFENNFPIGFSTKRDYKWIFETFLFSADESGLSIPLSDVIIRYEQKHEVDRRDYSPANEVVTFDFVTNPEGIVTLYKEVTSKLFELKIFSDFVGFEQSSPNGLIQVELERRLNLRTRRNQIFNYGRTSLGWFQFITPILLKSKFEENNKHLILDVKDQFINNQYTPIKFTSTLELKRFENFSVGADLNLFLVDFPSSKLTYYINSGFRYGRVAIRDSVRIFENNAIRNTKSIDEFGANTYQLMPIKAIAEFKADERYSVNLAWSLNFYFLRDNNFEQVANIPVYKDNNGTAGDFKYIYHNVSIGAAFKPNASAQGRLFFRYRYNWQQGYWRTGFHQAQIGYSVYLTKTLKPPQPAK